MHEHVVRGRQHCVHVDRDRLTDSHLESTHVARVSRVLQAVLVAFEEEFHEEFFHDVRIRWSLVSIATALFVSTSSTHDLMSEKNPTHMRVFILSFIDYRLFSNRIDHSNEQVLFLFDAVTIL